MGRSFGTANAAEMQSSGDRLDAPGAYHFIVDNAKYGEMPYSDDSFEGYSFAVTVIEGPHVGKSMGLLLNEPNESHKDGGAFARRRLTAAFVAANLLKVDHIGHNVEIDESMAAGAQVIATVKFGKDREGNKSEYLDLDGAKIYHVDDPRATEVKKNSEKLAEIHPGYRHPANYFSPIMPATSGNGGSKPAAGAAANAASNQPSTATAQQSFDETGL